MECQWYKIAAKVTESIGKKSTANKDKASTSRF